MHVSHLFAGDAFLGVPLEPPWASPQPRSLEEHKFTQDVTWEVTPEVTQEITQEITQEVRSPSGNNASC